MKNIYVLSDTHFGHKRIIELCNRPFANVEEMDQAMVDNWNSVVDQDDTVIFGGDFMFTKKDTGIFEKLSGKKILIKGNHDHTVTRLLPWVSVWDRLEVNIDGVDFIIDHYPLESWNKQFHGSVHLFGHVHNSQEVASIPNRHCICVEFLDYTPKNIRDFLPTMEEKENYERT